jgi:HlyD family secretion protein
MKLRTWFIGLAVVLVIGSGAYLVWRNSMRSNVPDGFAQTHGRLEATRVMIAAKTPGRIAEILVREGDTVEAGQVVARMDIRSLNAQLHQAEAQTQRARDAKSTAAALVTQRKSELELARKQYERSREAYEKGVGSKQDADVDLSKTETAAAGLASARSQVVEAQSAIQAAEAEVERLKVEIEDCSLVAPVHGRVQYRLAEPGEILAAGGRVIDLIDLTDVYMILYLPEAEAGRAAIGAEARVIFDASPQVVIPATVSYVAAEAQFTPKTVETATERQKLAFQVRVRAAPELVRRYEPLVKSGIPGTVYIRLNPTAEWPANLQVHLPPPPPLGGHK